MARTLSATLEAQQKLGIISQPYLIAKIRRKWGGVIRYDWDLLYPKGGDNLSEVKLIGSNDVDVDGQRSQNEFYLDRFQAENSGWLSAIKIKVFASVNVKVAIYADSTGEPGALLSSNNISTACAAGWNTILIENIEITSAVYYWLAFIADGIQVNYHQVASTRRSRAETYATFTFPDPAGTGFSSSTNDYALIAAWQGLYEYDSFHTAAMPTDGSLIRLRVTEIADSRKLYYQRITSPDEASDFSAWTYLTIYDILAVASCAYGTNVSQFYIRLDKAILHRESTDNGASWGSWSVIDYSPTTAINGIDAAYKSNGDITLIWNDADTLYQMQRLSASWESKAACPNALVNKTGISIFYNSDWNIIATAGASAAVKSVSQCIFGDGGSEAVGDWSAWDAIIERGTTEPFNYHAPFVRRPDTTRLYFVEEFTQAETQQRLYYSHSPAAAVFKDNAWLEPVPMNAESVYGLCPCNYGSYAWLTNANKVYRALATDDELDISSKLLIMDMRQSPDIRKGKVTITVNNLAGVYNDFARLGDELTIGLGYKTSAGNEYSLASSFWITKYELVSPSWSIWRTIYPTGILGTLVIETQDAWDFLKRYKTRRPYSWSVGTKTVLELLTFFLARAGLTFEVLSSSSAAQNFKPLFEVGRGASYRTIVKNLLKMVPDQLIFREYKAILRNPTTAEAVDWTYHNIIGTAMTVFRGKYGTSAWDPNRAEVWGDTFMKMGAEWPQIQKMRDRLSRVTTPTYPDLTRAGERAAAELRKAEILTGEDSWLLAMVNCGLEPWDKIQITDQASGVTDILRRVIRIKTYWSARSWLYTQTCTLGAD